MNIVYTLNKKKKKEKRKIRATANLGLMTVFWSSSQQLKSVVACQFFYIHCQISIPSSIPLLASNSSTSLHRSAQFPVICDSFSLWFWCKMCESVVDLGDFAEILVAIQNAASAGDSRGTVDNKSNYRTMPLGEPAEAPSIHLEFQGRMASQVRFSYFPLVGW